MKCIFNEADYIVADDASRQDLLNKYRENLGREDDVPVQATIKGEFNDGKRSRGRSKNSWSEAVNKDSASFRLNDWQKVTKDRSIYKTFLDSGTGYVPLK
jgi:hypothetical protein